jgi:hypothetical protein
MPDYDVVGTLETVGSAVTALQFYQPKQIKPIISLAEVAVLRRMALSKSATTLVQSYLPYLS